MATVIAKRTPLTDGDLRNLEATTSKSGFDVVLSPLTNGQSHLEKLVDAGPYSTYVAAQDADISPPTDDRPFFFYFTKGSDLFNVGKQMRVLVNPAMWILLACGMAVVALTLVFILLPLVVHRSDVLRAGTRRDLARRLTSLAFFCTIGLGFITVEIALMQKLGMFLGHPSYGLIVVLFSVLVATAVGARISERVPDSRRVIFAMASAIAVALISFAYAGLLSGALRNWVAWPLTMRVGLAVALTGAVGLVHGHDGADGRSPHR